MMYLLRSQQPSCRSHLSRYSSASDCQGLVPERVAGATLRLQVPLTDVSRCAGDQIYCWGRVDQILEGYRASTGEGCL